MYGKLQGFAWLALIIALVFGGRVTQAQENIETYEIRHLSRGRFELADSNDEDYILLRLSTLEDTVPSNSAILATYLRARPCSDDYCYYEYGTYIAVYLSAGWYKVDVICVTDEYCSFEMEINTLDQECDRRNYATEENILSINCNSLVSWDIGLDEQDFIFMVALLERWSDTGIPRN